MPEETEVRKYSRTLTEELSYLPGIPEQPWKALSSLYCEDSDSERHLFGQALDISLECKIIR